MIPASVSFLYWFHKSRFDRSKGLGWKLRFSLRALRYFGHCREWIAYVREVIAPHNPDHAADLFQQTMRPFYCHRYCSREISSMLTNAHQLAASMFGETTYASLLSGQRLPLCHVAGIVGEYKINLEFSRVPSRESVFSLKFVSENSELTELGFLFDTEGSDIICRVGVLQTLHISTNLQTIRCVSKDLHHVHPRAFLMHALRKLCQHYGVTRIEGISSRNHIWNAPRYKHKDNAKLIKYDEIWAKFGGRVKPDGNFELPVVQAERSLESYPQKKWNIIRKKQKLLASLRVSAPRLPNAFARTA